MNSSSVGFDWLTNFEWDEEIRLALALRNPLYILRENLIRAEIIFVNFPPGRQMV
jgi:hypothetical protein